jgi:glyoxalase family protein
MKRVLGLHHMTAICGDAQENVDFYVGLLGLRLVKRTVNFDDPTAYHLYYGDAVGSPGTLLTFFPYPGAPSGRQGPGQVVFTSLSIPEGSRDYWKARLADIAVDSEDGTAIDFADPDGLLLRLVPDPAYHLAQPWHHSPVPLEHQIAGIHAVTLRENQIENTAALLMRVLEFDHDEQAETADYVFRSSSASPGNRVDVTLSGFASARPGKGTVHHIAFRTPDTETQLKLRDELTNVGASVSDVRDRDYFQSIYFREPGGVLFEIATDGPGFAADEDVEHLGNALMLPAMHEPNRAEIESQLPPLRVPSR